MDQLGMTLADYRKMLETQYLMRRVQEQEIAPGMSVTEEEMRQFHAAHPDQFQTPSTITLREIFIAVPTETKGGEAVVNVAAAEAAQAKIQAARERILKGEDFAKVAEDVSESASKSTGGSIGQLNISDLNPQIATALGKLKAGEITEPIRTGAGWVLYKVDARSETGVRPFDEVRGEIQQRIMGERVGKETEKFLEKQRAIALIEWKDESLKKMYEEALKTRQANLAKTS
jgi:parvulin-like peptidyl-prolyl isomerase